MAKEFVVYADRGHSDSLRKTVKIAFTLTPVVSDIPTCSSVPVVYATMDFRSHNQNLQRFEWDLGLAFSTYNMKTENSIEVREPFWRVPPGHYVEMNPSASNRKVDWSRTKAYDSYVPLKQQSVIATNYTTTMQNVALGCISRGLDDSFAFQPIAAYHPLQVERSVIAPSGLLLQAYILTDTEDCCNRILRGGDLDRPIFASPLSCDELPHSSIWRLCHGADGVVQLKTGVQSEPNIGSIANKVEELESEFCDSHAKLYTFIKETCDRLSRLENISNANHDCPTEVPGDTPFITASEARILCTSLARSHECLPRVDERVGQTRNQVTQLRTLVGKTQEDLSATRDSISSFQESISTAEDLLSDVYSKLPTAQASPDVALDRLTLVESMGSLQEDISGADASLTDTHSQLGATNETCGTTQSTLSPPSGTGDRLVAMGSKVESQAGNGTPSLIRDTSRNAPKDLIIVGNSVARALQDISAIRDLVTIIQNQLSNFDLRLPAVEAKAEGLERSVEDNCSDLSALLGCLIHDDLSEIVQASISSANTRFLDFDRKMSEELAQTAGQIRDEISSANGPILSRLLEVEKSSGSAEERLLMVEEVANRMQEDLASIKKSVEEPSVSACCSDCHLHSAGAAAGQDHGQAYQQRRPTSDLRIRPRIPGEPSVTTRDSRAVAGSSLTAVCRKLGDVDQRLLEVEAKTQRLETAAGSTNNQLLLAGESLAANREELADLGHRIPAIEEKTEKLATSSDAAERLLSSIQDALQDTWKELDQVETSLAETRASTQKDMSSLHERVNALQSPTVGLRPPSRNDFQVVHPIPETSISDATQSYSPPVDPIRDTSMVTPEHTPVVNHDQIATVEQPEGGNGNNFPYVTKQELAKLHYALDASLADIRHSENRLSSLESSLGHSQDQVSSLQQFIGGTSERITVLESSVIRTQEDVSGLKDVVDAITSQLCDVDRSLPLMEAKASALDSSLRDAETRLASLENCTDRSRKDSFTLPSIQEAVQDTQKRLSSIDEAIAGVQVDLSIIRQSTSGAEQRITAVEQSAHHTQYEVKTFSDTIHREVLELKSTTNAMAGGLAASFGPSEDRIAALEESAKETKKKLSAVGDRLYRYREDIKKSIGDTRDQTSEIHSHIRAAENDAIHFTKSLRKVQDDIDQLSTSIPKQSMREELFSVARSVDTRLFELDRRIQGLEHPQPRSISSRTRGI